MRNPRLASVYAKSLLELAQKQDSLDAVHADMQYLLQVMKVSSDFRQVLQSPIIKSDKKAKILEAVIKPNVNALTWAFLTLVLRKRREPFLDQIAAAFAAQYNSLKGIQEVSLTTAVALDEEVKSKIVKEVNASGKFSEVKIHAKINPDIIGGFILEFNNNLVDASVSRKLDLIRRTFADTTFVSGY